MKDKFENFLSELKQLKKEVGDIIKGKSNKRYTDIYDTHLKKVNADFTYLEAVLERLSNFPKDKKDFFIQKIQELIESKIHKTRLNIIDEIEMFYPKLLIEFEDIKMKSFDVPDTIPFNEARLDLEEAIRDYENLCYISAIVLCRRAYEGALVEMYKSIENKEPTAERKCNKCKATLGILYMGITNLHKWAIDKGIVNEKFRNAGLLIADLGAGGAHPPLKDFPRDKSIARVTIVTAMELLNEVYSDKKRKVHKDL